MAQSPILHNQKFCLLVWNVTYFHTRQSCHCMPIWIVSIIYVSREQYLDHLLLFCVWMSYGFNGNGLWPYPLSQPGRGICEYSCLTLHIHLDRFGILYPSHHMHGILLCSLYNVRQKLFYDGVGWKPWWREWYIQKEGLVHFLFIGVRSDHM